MAYTALYRKLRPETFADIIGQEHIVKILTNQIKSNRVSHAYLFCGTRGTGKTSTSKVFAKALNCENPIDVEPCNQCNSCINAKNNNNLNIIEIDAASNNGVDNIRDIKDEVKYPPTNGKYKIYIIDEVHMLSIGAFNALLKTLEEPPAHVIFILATTDPQKIPPTILSRCQRLDFHRIASGAMTEALKDYMAKEDVKIDESALKYIAKICDGAMRDALSLLDQCMAYYYGEDLTIDRILRITGSVDNQVFFELIEALNSFESGRCIEIIGKAMETGKDIHQFVSDLILNLRNLLVSISTNTNSMDMSDEAFEAVKEKAKSLKKENLVSYINEFSALQSQMKYSQSPRILLETACIKLTNPESAIDGGNLSLLTDKIEKMISQGTLSAGRVSADPDKAEKTEKKTVNPVKKAVPEDLDKVIASWDAFIKYVGEKDVPLYSKMKGKTYAGYLEGDMLYIVAQAQMGDFVKSKEEALKALLTDYYNVSFPFIVISEEDYDSRHSNKYGAKDENSAKIKVKNISERLNGFTQID